MTSNGSTQPSLEPQKRSTLSTSRTNSSPCHPEPVPCHPERSEGSLTRKTFIIMNKNILLSAIFALVALCTSAQEFNPIPLSWKWIGDEEVIFTYNGTYEDADAFVLDKATLGKLL